MGVGNGKPEGESSALPEEEGICTRSVSLVVVESGKLEVENSA